MILEEPPLLDALEVTDKGSLNQRALLTRRAALVEELYQPAPPVRVIQIPPS
jgi:feruloyl-CoA synthase